MSAEEIEREIEALRADQVAFTQERQALEKRLGELEVNWHRLGGAIIAYQKVLGALKAVPATTTDRVPSTEIAPPIEAA